MQFNIGDRVQIKKLPPFDPLYDEDVERVENDDVGYVEDYDTRDGRDMYLMSWEETYVDEDDDSLWIYGENLKYYVENTSIKMLIKKVYGT